MPFPFVPAILSGGILFSLLFGRRPPSSETKPIEPPEPPPGPGPKPPILPPVEPKPLPVIPKIPGTDRPVADNMFVVDAPKGLRVHSAPAVKSSVIAVAKNGSTVTVLQFDVPAPPPPIDDDHSEEFGWAQIRIDDARNGFVARRYLSSSGVSGTDEIKRQAKEKELSEDEAPIITVSGMMFGALPPHYARRGRRRMRG